MERPFTTRVRGPRSFRSDDHLRVADPLASKRPIERDFLRRQRRHSVRTVEIVVLRPLPGRERLQRQTVELPASAVEQRQSPVGITGHDTGVEIVEDRLEEGVVVVPFRQKRGQEHDGGRDRSVAACTVMAALGKVNSNGLAAPCRTAHIDTEDTVTETAAAPI